MNFRIRFTFTALSFSAALLVGTITSDSATAAPFTTELACCVDAEDPSTCFFPASSNDLTECDSEDEMLLCDLDDGEPISCEPVDLECCSLDLEYCQDFEPGIACAGVVIVEPEPEVGFCCWCRGAYPVCEVELSESCSDGGTFAPIACT